MKTNLGFEKGFPWIKVNYPNLTYHIIAWTVLIIYENSVLLFATGRVYSFSNFFWYYLINIALFYSNVYLAFGYAFHKYQRPVFFLPFLILIELGLYIVVSTIISDFLYNDKRDEFFRFELPAVARALWRGIYFILLGTAYWFAIRIMQQRKNISDLEKEHLLDKLAIQEHEKNLMRSHNAYLQSRINPHLLFNTLNFLYDSVHSISPSSAESVILLSDIMRYSLEDVSEDGKVKLVKEWEQIINYIALQQLRVRNEFDVRTSFSIENEQVKIIPLVLLSLVENIFKHGNLTGTGKYAVIRITECKGKLEFYSINFKNARNSQGFNVGISHNRTRLENYYPGKFSLTLTDAADTFEVRLTIDI